MDLVSLGAKSIDFSFYTITKDGVLKINTSH